MHDSLLKPLPTRRIPRPNPAIPHVCHAWRAHAYLQVRIGRAGFQLDELARAVDVAPDHDVSLCLAELLCSTRLGNALGVADNGGDSGGDAYIQAHAERLMPGRIYLKALEHVEAAYRATARDDQPDELTTTGQLMLDERPEARRIYMFNRSHASNVVGSSRYAPSNAAKTGVEP